MSADFTSLEIFEIAEQIEQNGVEFYTAAGEKSSDKGLREFLLGLAETEKGHARDFGKMKEEVKNGTKRQVVFDPDNEIAYYLKAMAVSAGWEGKAAPRIEFSGNETPADILKSAVKSEKASIDYYLGLRELVEGEADKILVDRIIKEELIHAVRLQKELDRLS